MSVEFNFFSKEYTLLLKGQMTHRAALGTDPRGNLTRIDNALAQMALLPFRSLVITGMVDRPGTYVTILAKEDRSKELRQRRPSVRRQLKQEPRPAEKPEKKSPAHKKKEPER